MTIAEIIGVSGGAAAIFGLIVTILLVSGRLGQMAGTLETSLTNQESIITDLKNEMIELRRVVTQIAVFSNRLDTQGASVALLTKKVDELAHGEGFVVPFERIRTAIES